MSRRRTGERSQSMIIKEKHFDSVTATDTQLQVGQFKGLQSVG